MLSLILFRGDADEDRLSARSPDTLRVNNAMATIHYLGAQRKGPMPSSTAIE